MQENNGTKTIGDRLRTIAVWFALVAAAVGASFLFGRSSAYAETGGSQAVLVDRIVEIRIDADGNGWPEWFARVDLTSPPIISRNDDGSVMITVGGTGIPFPPSPQTAQP
jgi:hypothetical protein